MTLRQHFLEIKSLFFSRWDRQNLWRITTKSRRNVHGHCDRDRRVIAIVIQHTDPDERDRLLIHEICHAVANGSHGKAWQDRMEQAVKRADELGRDGLAKRLRQEIVNYQEFAEGREQAYQTIQDWLNAEPDLTLAQVKRSLADLTGLLVCEVSTKLEPGGEAGSPGSKSIEGDVAEGGSGVTSITTTPRHGVLIRQHKNWNTKTVYNNGHVMRIYRRQPKVLRFQSPMVNDFNQHLCGGWSMTDIGDEKEATVRQLLMGKKPFACISFWPDRHSEAVKAQQRLMSAGLVTDLRKRIMQSYFFDHIWDLLACHHIRVKDIGDLRALEADYAGAFGSRFLSEEIRAFAGRKLSSFFDGWDSPPLPLWLTGLILGYPVENTISIYLQ